MKEIGHQGRKDIVYNEGKPIDGTDSYGVSYDQGKIYISVFDYHPGILELDEEDLTNLLNVIKEDKSNKKNIGNIKNIFNKFILRKKGLENKLD